MPQVATLEKARTTKAVRDECLNNVFTSARGIVETVIRKEYSGMRQIIKWLINQFARAGKLVSIVLLG